MIDTWIPMAGAMSQFPWIAFSIVIGLTAVALWRLYSGNNKCSQSSRVTTDDIEEFATSVCDQVQIEQGYTEFLDYDQDGFPCGCRMCGEPASAAEELPSSVRTNSRYLKFTAICPQCGFDAEWWVDRRSEMIAIRCNCDKFTRSLLDRDEVIKSVRSLLST